MGQIYNNEKISTDIYGLDCLLFGGLQLQDVDDNHYKPLTIVIYGQRGTSKSLLGMQLLHGLTKSLRKLPMGTDPEKGIGMMSPVYYTVNDSERNFSDMLLDMLISKCTNHIIEEQVKRTDAWQSSDFSTAIFQVENNSKVLSLDCSILDKYIGEEAVVYNNRTNALHLVMPYSFRNIDNESSKFQIAKRRYDSIHCYCQNLQSNQLHELIEDFFDIEILEERNFVSSLIIPADWTDMSKRVPCLLIDDDYQNTCIDFLKTKALVVIRVTEDVDKIDTYHPDLVIEMRNHEDEKNGYLTHQLSIQKSVLQTTALGWHLYKKRDYGIEIYPSSHVLLQRRRHMPKGVLRSHLDILSETYQHYLDAHEDILPGAKSLVEFEKGKELRRMEKINELYEHFHKEECVSDILKKIMIDPISVEGEGRVTAIIGEPNTYKRYLTLGGTFSACCRGEHTLNVLLDKEDTIMFKRMICPAMVFGAPKELFKCRSKLCFECYECIHFKEIRMGCISSDEFFYYLMKQLRISREAEDESKRIKRIVIDDLQKIDFCFPMLRGDSLFLTALVSICKDAEIDLFILCDKSSQLAQELRVQADNVICTERVDKEIHFYIERYSGYSDPSQIFGCRIKNIKDLFRCNTDKDQKEYSFNEGCIEGISVSSMNDFWVCNDTNKIVKYLDK